MIMEINVFVLWVVISISINIGIIAGQWSMLAFRSVRREFKIDLWGTIMMLFLGWLVIMLDIIKNMEED